MAQEKILVIDDSQQIREVIAKVLTSEGYVFVGAADGRTGLELLGKEKPDLILTDMQMPRMSGLEILQLLSQYKVDIPVVMMTAHGSETIAIEAFRLGVKDYIPKPFEVDVVLRVIERALAETRLRREKETLTRNLAAANQAMERRMQEMAVLGRVGQAVSALLEPPVLMKRIVEAAVYVCGGARGAFLLAEDGSLRFSAAAGFPARLEGTTAPLSSIVAGALKLSQPLMLAGAQVSQEPYGRDAPPPAAFLAAPIIAKGRAIGVLAVDRTQANRPFGDNDARLLAAIADYAAISLQNARLFSQVKSAQDQLQAVINSTTDGIVVFDGRGDVALANPAAREMLDTEIAPGHALLPSSVNNALIQLLSRAKAQGKPLGLEMPGARGKVLTATVSPAPEIGHVAILHDITQLKELERVRHETEQSELEQLRATYERYVPPAVAEQLLRAGPDALAAPEVREVIALHGGLRGFETLLNQVVPEALIRDVLNRYFETMSEIVLQHGGTIDKFDGESLLAVFGWPLAGPDDAAQAVACVTDMQNAFAQLGLDWEQAFGADLGFAAGIGHGMVIAGSIGSPQHQDYTVVGDAVSIARQLSEHAHRGEILMSRSVLDRLPGAPGGVLFDDFPPVSLRGQSAEHEIVLVRPDLAAARTRALSS
ncbi:MAG: response regulator [Chloroflexi bacterium]|nr:response regulator [Chloroflexota bacterium]